MTHTAHALAAAAALVSLAAAVPATAAETVEEVLRVLDRTRSVDASKESKSYPVIFDAYLEMTPPPMPIGPDFNLRTIHPGMSDWTKVSGWAESNGGMADALLAVESKPLFGLPYNANALASRYREASLTAEIGAGGSLRDNRFPYLDAIDVIAAYATAESYRRFEAGNTQGGLDLAVANIFLLRQCCDREFLAEVMHTVDLLNGALTNLRDMLYTYRDTISPDQCADLAIAKLPFLRPDRTRLLIPEGDRVVSEALIQEVFNSRGQPDREKFASTFAEIQSKTTPLTRFGAARRWRMIADVHDSEEAALDRLRLVYDDWWRRWRVEEYDPILDIPTQFDRTNPVRYAAVIYSMQDVQRLFDLRDQLVAQAHATAMAAGLVGYQSFYGNYPSSSDKMYAQFVRKRSDRDPFDTEFLPFKYRVLSERFPVDTPAGRIFIESEQAILYSKGQDHQDDRGSVTSADGADGDIVFWPPVQTLLREAGRID
ncbi:MAG: hypothetical protein KJO43_05985 [Phycisphaerae bacterium]|nr:hypothetical protein [Phycisphaerae bacterium]NNF42330.1 hypothetical protein [Phycisphaerales bacterium]